MNCLLINDIQHSCLYNPGGITAIYMLNIDDFVSYRFTDDLQFNKAFVERIKTRKLFTELASTKESSFSESQDNGMYKQELTTAVGTLSGDKLFNLLLTNKGRYLIAFKTTQQKIYCFGSDGGASLSFTQQSGKEGESSVYQITISKSSVYPLFEVDADNFNKFEVLGTEDLRIAMTEDCTKAILVGNTYSTPVLPKPEPEPEPELDIKPDSWESELVPKADGSVYLVVYTKMDRDNGKVVDADLGKVANDQRDYDSWNPQLPDNNASNVVPDLIEGSYNKGNYELTWFNDASSSYTKTDEGTAKKTYKTRECDEIEVFAQPVVSRRGRSVDQWNWNRSDVRSDDFSTDNFFGENLNISLQDFDNLYGSYFPRMDPHTCFFFQKDLYFYADKANYNGTKQRIEKDWGCMTKAEMYQLIGEMPRYKNNFWTDFVDFFFCSAQDDSITHGTLKGEKNQFLNAANISRLTFTPLGSMANSDSDPTSNHYSGKRPCNPTGAFGKCLGIMLSDNKSSTNINDFSMSVISQDVHGFSNGVTIGVNPFYNAHGGMIRYARTKTPQELGYKLIVDKTKDKVLFVSPSWTNTNSSQYEELPTGLERGIALRYANRTRRLITQKWSSIVQEATEIKQNITIY